MQDEETAVRCLRKVSETALRGRARIKPRLIHVQPLGDSDGGKGLNQDGGDVRKRRT